LTIDIREYEYSEQMPAPAEYPRPPAIWEEAPGLKYADAFKIAEDDQEAADIYLWMLVGYSLRHDEVAIYENDVLVGRRPLKWREAFEREREALAWRAFQKDIGTNREGKTCFDIGDDWGLYTMVDGQRVERTTHRDYVWKLFGARLPERITGRQDDILERVHFKREKAAKAKGESCWRNGHTPKPEQPAKPRPGGLFE